MIWGVLDSNKKVPAFIESAGVKFCKVESPSILKLRYPNDSVTGDEIGLTRSHPRFERQKYPQVQLQFPTANKIL